MSSWEGTCGLLLAVGLLVTVGVNQQQAGEIERLEKQQLQLFDMHESHLIELSNGLATVRNEQLADRAAASASVTSVPCTLRDIYEKARGC